VRTTARKNEISFSVNSSELNFSAKSNAVSTVSIPKARSKQSLFKKVLFGKIINSSFLKINGEF
jgi:hypothetical protein